MIVERKKEQENEINDIITAVQWEWFCIYRFDLNVCALLPFGYVFVSLGEFLKKIFCFSEKETASFSWHNRENMAQPKKERSKRWQMSEWEASGENGKMRKRELVIGKKLPPIKPNGWAAEFLLN